MRTRTRRWLLWVLVWAMHFGEGRSAENPTNNDNNAKEIRGIFAPRMDYEKWKPLGSGDPLKNDPTTVYVPPVLDRVHYWIDPAARTPDPPEHGHQKTEILLLGVSSKKPSTGTSLADSRKDSYDSFLKFVDAPKFNHHQRVSRPHFTSSFFPQFYKNKQFSKGGEQRVPYTMLMPPPMVTDDLEPTKATPIHPLIAPSTSTIITTPGTTTTLSPPLITRTTQPSSVTLQESNLVYHSSSLGGLNNEWGKHQTTPTISLTPNPVSFTMRPNVINQPLFPEKLVYQKHLQPPESYIQIQFAPALNLTNKQLSAANSDQVNFVTAPPLAREPELMHKGEVTDDNLDISNTYVQIGKTEAQMHSTALDNMPELLEMRPSPLVFTHVQHPMVMMTQTPVTMQTLQTMQTMLPPPMTTSPVYKRPPILEALEREKTAPPLPETTLPPPTTTETLETTTVTTSAPMMTTDPLFRHYKQPAEPLKGPLYLIIQGHSKVKTYGPGKQIHGIRVQQTNEILDDSSRKTVKIKHLHDNSYLGSFEGGIREGRSRDLQTLKHVIQAKLGAIDLGQAQRRRGDFKEAELQFGYKVADEGDVTSERYRKGIVEEARKLEPEPSSTPL